VVGEAAVPATIVGVPNRANALVPEPSAVIATELLAPVLAEVIARLVPEAVTLAPVI